MEPTPIYLRYSELHITDAPAPPGYRVVASRDKHRHFLAGATCLGIGGAALIAGLGIFVGFAARDRGDSYSALGGAILGGPLLLGGVVFGIIGGSLVHGGRGPSNQVDPGASKMLYLHSISEPK